MGEKVLNYKYDVDKVLTASVWSEKVIKQHREDLKNIQKDIVELQEHKVDHKEYKQRVKELDD